MLFIFLGFYVMQLCVPSNRDWFPEFSAHHCSDIAICGDHVLIVCLPYTCCRPQKKLVHMHQNFFNSHIKYAGNETEISEKVLLFLVNAHNTVIIIVIFWYAISMGSVWRLMLSISCSFVVDRKSHTHTHQWNNRSLPSLRFGFFITSF